MDVPRRRRRRSVLQHLADHNPFYLSSAASMLLACVLLSNTTTYQPIGLSRLVGLIATLGVYELLLVGLGLYLIARRGLARDGVMLLVLEALFLADVGFLASEAYQHSLRAGLLVNGALLAVGTLKLAAVFRALRMPIASPAFAVVLATLAMLLGHPAWLKEASAADAGRVSQPTMYAAWWAAAALVVLYGLALRRSPPSHFRGTRPGVARAGLGHVFACVLLASVVAHLGTAHWVYKSDFAAADLSPLLAALPVVLSRAPRTPFFGAKDATFACVAFPAAAVLASLGAPDALAVRIAGHTCTPAMFAAGAAYLSLADSFAPQYFARLALAGAAAAAAYAVAPSWATIQQWAGRLDRWASDLVDRLIPHSQTAWGVLAAAGAFALLAVGAVVSLSKPREDADGGGDDAPPADGPPPPVTGAG